MAPFAALKSETEIICKFSLVMEPSRHSVLDPTPADGGHLAALEEKTLIRFFSDQEIYKIPLVDYSFECQLD